MGTEEGERMIHKVAKQRARSRRDIGEVNVIKDQIGEMLTDEVKIKERRREYFSNLLNVENATEQLGEVPAVEGPVQDISREEVKKAIEEGKTCRMLRPPGRPYQTPRGEWSGHDAWNTEESLGRRTDARGVEEKWHCPHIQAKGGPTKMWEL